MIRKAFLLKKLRPDQNSSSLQTLIVKFSLNYSILIYWQIKPHLKSIPRDPVDNEPAFIKVYVWRHADDRPLPYLMMVQFIDAYMRHQINGLLNAVLRFRDCLPLMQTKCY